MIQGKIRPTQERGRGTSHDYHVPRLAGVIVNSRHNSRVVSLIVTKNISLIISRPNHHVFSPWPIHEDAKKVSISVHTIKIV